jgi:protein SCO1/2
LGLLDRLERAMNGGALPAFALVLLVLWEVLLVGLLLAPGEETGLGAFADEFRIWCFGLDPATGRLDPGLVLGMTTPPLLLGAILALLWWEPLRALAARPRALLSPALLALALVSLGAASFALLGNAAPAGDLPFPADDLRTRHRAPALALTSHTGETLALEELRGQVVLLTAVYASCPHACPLILDQTRRAIAELDPQEQGDLRMVAVTLDPRHDSPDVLTELAELHDFRAPLYNFVTGEAADVERVLDAMNVARRLDPDTGIIDHVNLFLLIDREGQLAYRLTLGEQQERWLIEALRLLLREPAELG